MRSVMKNWCRHCHKEFTAPCVGGLTLCHDCREAGHTDVPYYLCPKCRPEQAILETTSTR